MVIGEHDKRRALLRQHCLLPGRTPNVRYDTYLCECGQAHVAVITTTKNIEVGDVLVHDVGLHTSGVTLLVQFDGSYKPRWQVEGRVSRPSLLEMIVRS